ncbi:MAG: Triosephosphate isomerase [Acidobacteriota bacterium]|nr:Triosephosphate isomerase [Acidobacteriota bacterium]
MKDYIIAGNWKMFKTVEESISFITQLDEKLGAAGHFPDDLIEVLVFPPFTSLYPVKGLSPRIKTGAQDFYFEDQGAYTGEISPLMLKNVVDYVLIGHSERRQLFHESDENINKKIKAALVHGFIPVLCIGETLEEREAGKTFARIEEQLAKDLCGLTPGEAARIVIAYEPIWAIGTGRNASPEQAQEAHAFIRKILHEKTGNPEIVRILYGGSVKPENSLAILSQNDINGVLVGGASLKVDAFSVIIENSVQLLNSSIR